MINAERRSVAPIVLLALFSLTFAFGWGQAATPARAQGPTNEYSLEIRGAVCSTRPGEPRECELPGGSHFTVAIYLESLNLPDSDEDTIAGYLGFQVQVTNSDELSQVDGVEQSEVVWPDCTFAVEARATGTVTVGCATAGTPSTFIGLVAELSYICGPPGSTGVLTMLHGLEQESQIVDDFTNVVSDDSDSPSESLAVSCTEGTAWTPSATSPPPDRPLPTEVEVPPAATGGDDGTTAGLWVAIVAVVALALLAVLGWRYRRPGARRDA